MDEKLKIIYRAFDGKLVGSQQMKMHVCETLAKMPQDIIETVTKTCWFMSSMTDAWAFTFTGNDLKDQHLIFLSEDLLDQDISQIQWTIAHEIGHVILNHRNSTVVRQSKEEIAKQEAAADNFARTHL
jgi:hypothetical protein